MAKFVYTIVLVTAIEHPQQEIANAIAKELVDAVSIRVSPSEKKA